MRYEVIREVPLHDNEHDTSQPLDSAHRLVIGNQVDVDTDIQGKARVKVTVVEPPPRRTGWMTTNESLKLLVPEPDIDPNELYDLLKLKTVGKADQRYLFALAFAESGLKNVPSPIAGSDGFGPFQYTSARWMELLHSVDADLTSEGRMDHRQQATLAIAEVVAAMKQAETALSRPVLRNELYLLHLLPTSAADVFLKAVKDAPTTPIDTILTDVPDAARFMEQYPTLLQFSNRTATVAEALDLAASALQPGLDKSVELDPPPGLSLPPGLTVFEAKCRKFMPRLMEQFQLTAQQTAGVFGNLGHESDGFTAFHERGQPEGKGGYGWAQWTGSRRVDFFEWCKNQVPALSPESDEGSYGFLCFELEHKQAAALQALKGTATIEDAVDTFEQKFEKAGIPNMPSRYEWARKAFAILTHPPQQRGAPAQLGATAGSTPPWVTAGLTDLGFRETGENQGIERFIAEAHCGRRGDQWCAIWANAKLEVSGIRGTRSTAAVSFCDHSNFVKLDGPALGAIAVWDHHVGFYLRESPQGILTLGGNQSDGVCKGLRPIDNTFRGYWWPTSVPRP
jgi:tail lysozyme